MTDARVRLWDRDIGAVSWIEDQEIGIFQYTSDFVRSGIEVAPLMMPLKQSPYQFSGLDRETFKGLPGMLADSLPDKFGNQLIDAWLAARGRLPNSLNPVERLCYTGTRGMGALEFKPVINEAPSKSRKVDVEQLVGLANRVLDKRIAMQGKFTDTDDKKVMEDILRVGTSAGGARAKAVLAWNQETGEFRSGQVKADKGFTYWLMKFDGIHGNKDKEISDPQGFGRIEYAYHLMAKAAGINMMPCRLHEEGGRAHFMTQRYDRLPDGEKVHAQTLGALQHFNFNDARAYSYEQAILTIRQLGLPMSDIEEQFRRAVFNVVARNQDDHVKNISFLMDKAGQWRLSPAYDIAYSYNPAGHWTGEHQMSLAGKTDNFEFGDLIDFARSAGMKAPRAKVIIEEITHTVSQWQSYAIKAGVDGHDIARIGPALRLHITKRA